MKAEVSSLSARAIEAVLELVYPPACLVCGAGLAPRAEADLCLDCERNIRRIEEPTCRRCGAELGPYTASSYACQTCRNLGLRFRRAHAAAHFTDTVRELILALKFRRDRLAVRPLIQILLERAEELALGEQVDEVVPVPLHWFRRRRRGFNQSELFARAVADRLHRPVELESLRRVRPTAPQTQLGFAARQRNLAGAFRVGSPDAFAGKRILLVDDVLTSGATCSACAKALKEAGAKTVIVLTVARAVPGQ